MPSPTWTLTRFGQMRLPAISFFLVGLLGSAAGVRWLWNSLQRDVPRLPRFSYGQALAAVVLWGIAFTLVLTMISGARELMTPGAWTLKGATYTLAEGGPSNADVAAPHDADILAVRRKKLEELRFALWDYALRHDGRFPATQADGIPSAHWEAPDPSQMRYRYDAGRTVRDRNAILALEPDIFGESRLALMGTGEIVSIRSESGAIEPPGISAGIQSSDAPAMAELPEGRP